MFGISEQHGLPTTLVGLGAVDADAAILRLEGIAQTGLDPRIPGLAFHAVALANGGQALIAAIPKSTVGPHMVIAGGQRRFFSRNSRGKYVMETAELRAAFATTGVLAAVRLELESVVAALLRRSLFRPDTEWIDARWGELINCWPEGDRDALRQALT